METFILAAIESRLPPIAVILSDPSHTEYTQMDYNLIKAYYLKQRYMSGDFPVWIDQSDRVGFEARSFTSKSQAAIERAQDNEAKALNKQNATPNYGRKWYAVPVLLDGSEWPTMREYVEEQERLRERRRERPE